MARKMTSDDAIDIAEKSELTNIDFGKLRELADKLMAQREDIAAGNQAAGNLVKTAEKEHGANAGAFKLLVRLMKMSPDARADFLRTLVPGLSAFELTPRQDLVDLMETA